MSHPFRPDQIAAINATGRTLVAAAAGSGKTSVLTERLAQALLTGAADPSEVLAVTYTRKAAEEMRTRLAERIHGAKHEHAGAGELVARLQLATIGTIHSLCADLLRRFGTVIGVDPGFSVIEEQNGAWINDQAFNKLLAEAQPGTKLGELRALLGDEHLRSQIIALDRLAQRRIRRAIHVADVNDIEIGDHDLRPGTRELIYTELPRAFSLWVAHRDEAERDVGGLGFGSLEQLALRLVSEHPAILTQIRSRFTQVLVDEFQDTNDVQYALLDAIAGPRLFMVGDEWQSIYRFTGANIDVFRARRSDVGDGLRLMRENFRSAPGILDVVNHVFAHDDVFGERYEPVVAGGTRENLSGPSVELLIVPCVHDDDSPYANLDGRELVGRRIADRIIELVESGDVHFGPRADGSPGSSVAVLWQASTGADTFEAALRARGIPTIRHKSKGLYERSDVRDVMQVLALVRNRLDDRATLGVLSGPLAGCSWQTLLDLRAAAGDAPLWSTVVQQAAHDPAMQRVCSVIDELDRLSTDATLVEVVEQITELDEFVAYAANGADPRLRIANLRKLVQIAAHAQQVGVVDVSAFIDYVDAQRRGGDQGNASIAGEDAGAVQLMTIHAAKGLEFEHVFVVDIDRSTRAQQVEPLADETGRVELPLVATNGKLVRSVELDRLHDLEKAREQQERLRKYYVAFTRAEHRLYIAGSFNQTPTAKGAPRALRGDLKWLASALELPEFLECGPTGTRTLLGTRVLLDTRLPQLDRPPRHDLFDVAQRATLAAPTWRGAERSGAQSTSPATDAERAAMHQRLVNIATSAPVVEPMRELLHGERLHAAVATLLDTGPVAAAPAGVEDVSGVPAALRESRIVASLRARGARTEVPFAYADASGDVRVGRFDAIAVLGPDRWWIVDWKSSLPDTHLAAYVDHGAQLVRYAEAARAAGASDVLVTLASLHDADRTYSWRAGEQHADLQFIDGAPWM